LIKEAIRHYLDNAHRGNSSEGFVPFLEYKKLNEELRETLKRVGDLERRLMELSEENRRLREKLEKKKRCWFF
jgi:cell shape-determining protein MreC